MIIKIKYEGEFDDFYYLEKIYKKVKLYEFVRFNGKIYRRKKPVMNRIKYPQTNCPYNFYLVSKDAFRGNIRTLDSRDGKMVCMIASHLLEFE